MHPFSAFDIHKHDAVVAAVELAKPRTAQARLSG